MDSVDVDEGLSVLDEEPSDSLELSSKNGSQLDFSDESENQSENIVDDGEINDML